VQDSTVRTVVRLIAMLAMVTLCLAHGMSVASGGNRFIVSLHKAVDITTAKYVVERIAKVTQSSVSMHRIMSGHALILTVHHSPAPVTEVLKRIARLPSVADVVPDAAVTTMTTTVDDPKFKEQWQLHEPNQFVASLDVVNAWDITHGASEVVVAIIDTGIDYNHPDLTGRLLPGYDFVSNLSASVDVGVVVAPEFEFLRSNDGDGRDTDATDPGDAVDDAIREQFKSINIDCYVSNSSWHGTAMASIIAANPNDGQGIAGIDWHAKILPVRAIGKCGGRRSDMLDAIRWSAGVVDPALPPNPTPARIINLSLGVDDLCTTADQSAINDARAAGAIVVAAVGNNGRNTDAQPSSPSHCQNVLGVMAVDKNGFRANYSNVGRDADVAAPGGAAQPSTHKILVAKNNGETAPANDFGYRAATGTSVAAPHVSGVLALMLSVQPTLSNRELEALLLDNTRAFPRMQNRVDSNSSVCEKAYCGAGILDAFSAVKAAVEHVPGMFLDSPSLAAAQSVPVSVGGFTALGCTVASLNSRDPMLLMLGLSAAWMVRKRKIRLAKPQQRQRSD